MKSTVHKTNKHKQDVTWVGTLIFNAERTVERLGMSFLALDVCIASVGVFLSTSSIETSIVSFRESSAFVLGLRIFGVVAWRAGVVIIPLA